MLKIRICDSAGESRRDRIRNVFDHGSHSGHAQNNQDHAGHDRAHGQVLRPVLRIDSVKNDNERPGRAANRNFGSTQAGNDNACDDGRKNPGLRRHPGSDRESHCQRKRDNSNRHSRDKVGAKGRSRIILQRVQKLWTELRRNVHTTSRWYSPFL